MSSESSSIDPVLSTIQRFTRSLLVRAAVLAALALALQIPVLFIASLAQGRDETRGEAVSEMTSHWGGAQRLAGPFLVVPYRVPTRTVEAIATFLPTELRGEVGLATERLSRGIFEAPVYRSTAELSGTFRRPDFAQWGVSEDQVVWERAQVIFDLSDVRAIQTGARIEWAGAELSFEPGAGLRGHDRSGIHAPLAGPPAEDDWLFSASIEFNGSAHVALAPAGESTEVRISGDWPDPSFQGAWLPTDREISASKFSADWKIPHLGRNFPQSWRGDSKAEEIDAAMFGVALLSPVDAYRMTIRSLKYALLFLTLTFVTAWLFEVLAGARLHPIHYVLIGAAMILFYLLELALSEHIGFAAAYSIAATAVVLVNGGYAWSILSSMSKAGILAGTLVALYTCLYVLLQVQDYALLAGAIGIFIVLAGIMYVTRNVDWYSANLTRP